MDLLRCCSCCCWKFFLCVSSGAEDGGTNRELEDVRLFIMFLLLSLAELGRSKLDLLRSSSKSSSSLIDHGFQGRRSDFLGVLGTMEAWLPPRRRKLEEKDLN